MQDRDPSTLHPTHFNYAKKYHPKDESRSIFVGGIPSNSTHLKLRDTFSIFGPIAKIVIMRSQKGKSRGYCFIEFVNQHSVQDALDAQRVAMGGRMLNCKQILKGNHLKNSKRNLDKRRVYCDRVPQALDKRGEEDFKSIFSQFGELENFYFAQSREPQDNRFKIVHVIYTRVEYAKIALENMVNFRGHSLQVKSFKRKIFKDEAQPRRPQAVQDRQSHHGGLRAPDKIARNPPPVIYHQQQQLPLIHNNNRPERARKPNPQRKRQNHQNHQQKAKDAALSRYARRTPSNRHSYGVRDLRIHYKSTNAAIMGTSPSLDHRSFNIRFNRPAPQEALVWQSKATEPQDRNRLLGGFMFVGGSVKKSQF
jgi:RNA recognition motif-containing protein